MISPGTIMIFLAAVIMAVSFNHLFIAVKLKYHPLHLAIFLSGLTGTVYISMIYFGYQVDSSPEMVTRIYRYHLLFMQAAFLALLWALSLVYRKYSRKYFAWVVGVMAAFMVLTAFLPGNILFSSDPSVSIALFFGNDMNLLCEGARNWRLAADLTVVISVGLLLALAGRKLFQEGYKNHSQVVVASFLLLLAGGIDHLIDYGILNSIYLLPIAFFLVFSMMSSHSLRRMVDELRTSAEMAIEDRKFRRLFHEVSLLVVELDVTGHIKYVNPFLLELTGYKDKELIGKDWFEVVVPQSAAFELQSLFLDILSSEMQPNYQNPILTRAHGQRMISWYNVLVYDRYDKVAGSLSIGVDVTEQESEIQELRKSLKEARELIARLQGPLK